MDALKELLIPDPLRLYREMERHYPWEASICRSLAARCEETDPLTAAREMWAPELLKDRGLPAPGADAERLRRRLDRARDDLTAVRADRDRLRARLIQANRDLADARRHQDEARTRCRAAEDDARRLHRRATSAEARDAMTRDVLGRWVASYRDAKARAEAAQADVDRLCEDLAWSESAARGWANLRPVRRAWARWYRRGAGRPAPAEPAREVP